MLIFRTMFAFISHEYLYSCYKLNYLVNVSGYMHLNFLNILNLYCIFMGTLLQIILVIFTFF